MGTGREATDVLVAMDAPARPAAQRRRQRRIVILAPVVVVGAIIVGLARGDDDPAIGGRAEPSAQDSGSWSQLPEPPLSPRTGATVTWTGEEVIVVGGWELLCPPDADCAGPTSPPFSDGAALHLGTGTWRSIASAPVGLRSAPATAVDGSAFYLVDCDGPPSGFGTRQVDPCPGWDGSSLLLRYDPSIDAWEQHPGPPDAPAHVLEAVGDSVVAYATTEEWGEMQDWWRDPATGAWQSLPDDPLPAMFDRSLVAIEDGRSLLLVGAQLGPSSEPADEVNLVARLDLATMTWRQLPAPPSRGFRAWGIGATAVLEPHFGGTGGRFDPRTETWASLPGAEASFESSSVVGAFGGGDAAYAGSSGWVLDLDVGRWLELAPPDERVPSSSTVTAVGRDLFLFGGEQWDGSDGDLLGDAWLWTAPTAAGAPTTTP